MPDDFWMNVQHEDRLLAQAKQRRLRYQQMLTQADEQLARRAAEITTQHPNASPGVVQAATESGADDAAVAQVAGLDGPTLSAGAQSLAGWISGGASAVYEQGLKPLVRGVFMAADTLSQELIQRPVTAALNAEGNLLTNPGAFREAYNDYGDSPLVNYAQGDFATTDETGAPVEGGSLGTGFFAAGQAGQESMNERTLTVDGNVATLGRSLPTTRAVGAMFGYDSTAYNAVAGVSQFAADVLLDPLAIVTGGSATLARQATRAGLVAEGGRGARLLQGGAVGAVRDTRRLDPNVAKGILDEAKEAGDAAFRASPRPSLAAADRGGVAAQLLEEAGALKTSTRNTVLLEKARDFIGKPQVIEKLVESDAYTIAQSWKKSAANHVDHELIRELGKADNATRVSELLLDAIQKGDVTTKGFYSGLSGVRRTIAKGPLKAIGPDGKLVGLSARGRLSVDDVGDAADKLESFMRQANLDRDTIASTYNKLLDVDTLDIEQQTDAFFDIVTEAMGNVSENLTGEMEAIVKATRAYGEDLQDLRAFGIDAAADPFITPMFPGKVSQVTGELMPTPGVHITSELAQVGVELPDVTAIRRAAQRANGMQKIYNSAGWKMTSDGARWATRDLFKPLAILRPAYVVRIGLEEQLRLAAAGYDSLFTHPFRFLQANVLARTEAGASGRMARGLQALPGGGGVDEIKMNRSLTGEDLEETTEALHVINRRAYNVMSDKVQGRARRFTTMDRPPNLDGQKGTAYIKAWQHELAQLAAAREARWLAANGGDLDGFVDWARNTPEGRKVIDRMARVSDDAPELATSDDAVRAWGQTINERIAAKTGGRVSDDGVIEALGDEGLVRAIADGRMTGVRLSDQTRTANLHRTLRSKFETAAPQKIKAEIDDAADSARHDGRMRKAVDYLFDTFTGKPTAKLARYPAFRQSYIKRAGELMPTLADDATRARFARQIDESMTLTKAEKQDLTAAVAGATGKKGFYDDILELDEVVKVKAATEVKDLLFDVTNRSNIQDTYEVAVPFFDAWLEVTQTWAKLAASNPAFFSRAGQGYESFRNSGVVYANERGEEMFAFPGGGMLSKFFLGTDLFSAKGEGRVQGANLAAQGVGPGFGPIVQWGIGAFMPTTEEWSEIREWAAPFGTGGVESAGDLANPMKLGASFIPAWAEKALNAVTSGQIDETQWNATVGNVMGVLAESGRYDPGNPEDQQRLIEDAKTGGRFILLLRGLIQGVALTGPSVTWELKAEVPKSAIPEGWDPETDPDGTYHSIGVLGSELYSLAEFYDYDWATAQAKFIEMYGTEPHYITQSKSKALGEAPVTTEGNFWMQDHRDFVDRHRQVAGYFVPPEEDPQLDYSVYRQQFDSGIRQSLTPEQQLQLANQTKARSMYYNLRDQLADVPPKVSRNALTQARAILEEEFPGWNIDVVGVGQDLTVDKKIERLIMAAEDPDVQDSPVAEPVRMYLDFRSKMLQVAAQRGFSSLNNDSSADLRAALDQAGQVILGEHPDFRGVWSSLLRRELED